MAFCPIGKIDAQIDVKLTEIYLRKATGELTIDN